jgi:hypothetical protein
MADISMSVCIKGETTHFVERIVSHFCQRKMLQELESAIEHARGNNNDLLDSMVCTASHCKHRPCAEQRYPRDGTRCSLLRQHRRSPTARAARIHVSGRCWQAGAAGAPSDCFLQELQIGAAVQAKGNSEQWCVPWRRGEHRRYC